MLRADICVLTTPSLEVLQIKRSRGVKHYCHIVHSLTPMTYRVFGVDYFDSVLVANEIQGNFVREIEKARNIKAKYIAIVGSTYLDELAKLRSLSLLRGSEATEAIHKSKSGLPRLDCVKSRNDEVENDSRNNSVISPSLAEGDKGGGYKIPTILISPSWGKETLLSKYGIRLLEPLAKTNYHIIIRPHPQSLISEAESSNIKTLQNALKSYENVEWDINTPNVIAFSKADLMISDFSSVIFDFVCLEGKPVLTLDFAFDSAGYDLADIYDSSNISEFWTFKALKQIGGKISENDFANIKDKIDSALQSSANSANLANISKTLWQYPHNLGIKAALEILKIERDLLQSQLDKSILNRLDLTKNAILALESHKLNIDSPKSRESNLDSQPKKDL